MERPSRIELESKPWQGLVIAVILWSLIKLNNSFYRINLVCTK